MNQQVEITGDTEKLIGRVQERYGSPRAEAQRDVNDFFDRYPDIP